MFGRNHIRELGDTEGCEEKAAFYKIESAARVSCLLEFREIGLC
jgi:hypothetical protein